MLARSRIPSLRTPRRLCTGLANTVRTPLEKDIRWPGWEVVIGIEVHAQIKSREKLFSREFTHPGQLTQLTVVTLRCMDARPREYAKLLCLSL